jgi:hypothetical protein
MRPPEAGKTEALLRGLLYIPVRFEAARLAVELRHAWARAGGTFPGSAG